MNEQNLPHGHFVYHTLHLDWAGIAPELCREKPMTACAMSLPFGEISALGSVQILT